jgi:protein transport protein SEC13
VIVWSYDLNDSTGTWNSSTIQEFNQVVWHVSWSLTSNMLAVSGGDNKVTIWKEDHNGKYICINDTNFNSPQDK